jgi:hypothetical protein
MADSQKEKLHDLDVLIISFYSLLKWSILNHRLKKEYHSLEPKIH